MTRQDAQRLLMVLTAAFPNARVPDETIRLYVRMLEGLDSTAAAGDAVANLVKSARFFPTIAEILESYGVALQHRRASRPALEEPSLSEEQRLLNVERARELQKMVVAGLRSI